MRISARRNAPGSAAALAAIVLQSNQNDMFGGQSFGFFDTDMADFVEGAEENEVFRQWKRWFII